ncbi:uncharacterized protein LOC125576093 [Brassica napus]|uniref:uncharacterized protein LOC125576093 n=1 Tax=Brassica napus TaxID=3708 RepID=UPI002078D3D4|nr:uncharacterized protein LOC125576093 [Brassica napus]
MDLRGIYRVPFYINGKEIEKEFFQKMDDAENNLNKEHINVAFEMLNCKRVEQGAWFRNNNLPAACFVPVKFLEVVGYAYESVRKPHKKKTNVIGGLCRRTCERLISAIKMELLGKRSLGLKSMANINDETAMDLRSKLCCEIFNQFMDKDFQEGQRK